MSGTADRRFECVVVGRTGSGKTQMLRRCTGEGFSESHVTTVGADFYSYSSKAGGCCLNIWDLSGDERYRIAVQAYLGRAAGAIVTFDVTDRDSYGEVERWVRILRERVLPDTPIILVATKTDLPGKEFQVTQAEGEALKNARGLTAYVECSAKTGAGVDVVFSTLTRAIMEKAPPAEAPATQVSVSGFPITIPPPPPETNPKSPSFLKNNKTALAFLAVGIAFSVVAFLLFPPLGAALLGVIAFKVTLLTTIATGVVIPLSLAGIGAGLGALGSWFKGEKRRSKAEKPRADDTAKTPPSLSSVLRELSATSPGANAGQLPSSLQSVFASVASNPSASASSPSARPGPGLHP